MEWLQRAWDAAIYSSPNWDLILRFIQVLAWPCVALMTLVSVRPGRIVDAILENGGEVSAAGASIKLSKRIDEVAESIREDAVEQQAETGEAASDDPPAENPLGEAADAYTTVMNGWGLVVMALEEALERAQLDPLDGRRPIEAVRRLRQANLIGRRLETNVQRLWDLRNRVKSAGSNRVGRLGITADAANEYYVSAARVKRSMKKAIDYRERTGMIGGAPHSQIKLDLGGPASTVVN